MVPACIYCDRIADLSEEHVVPYALNGKMKLKNASCKECAKITSYIEGFCARELFFTIRIVYDFQSRRKNQRPDAYDLDVETAAGWETWPLDLKDHPSTPVIVPLLPFPKFIYPNEKFAPENYAGKSSRIEKSLDGSETFISISVSPLPDNEERLSRLRARGAIGYRYPVKQKTKIFQRMLAKIAHAYCAGVYGLDNIVPYLPGSILGHEDRLDDLVGGQPQVSSLDWVDDDDYDLCGGLWGGPPRTLLTCSVQLFARFGVPRYYVVVGEPSPELERSLREQHANRLATSQQGKS